MGNYLYHPQKETVSYLKVFAFGDNSYGNITHLNRNLNYTEVFTEHFQSFAIDSEGTIYSWGLNDFFQLGNGKNNNYLFSKSYDDYNNPGDREFRFINTFSVLYSEPSKYKKPFELLNAYFNPVLAIPFTSKSIKKISCGNGFSLFLEKNGKMYSCGRDDKGQLGYEISNNECELVSGIKCSPEIREIPLQESMTDIIAGNDFAFSQSVRGEYYSWGNNKNSQLAHESNLTYVFTPTKAEKINKIIDNGRNKIKKLCCGWMHGCLLDSNENLYIWGNPFLDYDKKSKNIRDPELIQIDQEEYRIIDFSSGFHHLGIVVNHKKSENQYSLMTLGGNEFGQLGYETDDDYTKVAKKVVIKGFENEVIQVICGAFHTIVRVKDDVLFGFGQNDKMQLGNYSAEFIKWPVNCSFFEEGDVEELKEKYLDTIICGNGSTILIYRDLKEYEERTREKEEKNQLYDKVPVTQEV